MQVSAFPAIFKADFGRFRRVSAVFRRVSAVGRYDPIWPIRPDFGRINPVQRESKLIRHESSRIGANRAESARIRKKKKKKTASDAGAAPLVPRPCFLGHHFIGNVTGNCNFQVVFMFHNYIHLFRKRRER